MKTALSIIALIAFIGICALMMVHGQGTILAPMGGAGIGGGLIGLVIGAVALAYKWADKRWNIFVGVKAAFFALALGFAGYMIYLDRFAH